MTGNLRSPASVRSAPSAPVDPLPAGAVLHLAHEMRGPLHTILGYAELLRIESEEAKTRESAAHVHASATALAAWVEDVVDLLRLPDAPDRGAAVLGLRSLLATTVAAAAARDSRVLIEESEPVVVDRAVARAVARVVHSVVAAGNSDVRVRRAPFRAGDEVTVVSIAPSAERAAVDQNGAIAIAARLLAAHGGGLDRSSATIRIHVPIRRSSPA